MNIEHKKITKNTVVSIDYTLSDAQGNVIEAGDEPIVYLHGGYEGIFPKIEEALEGQELGFETQVQLEPDDAFGEYDPELIKIEDRSRFPGALEVGMQFEGVPDEDNEEEDDEDDDIVIYTVTDIAEDKVVLDGNHPLAGIALRFSLKVTNVREASAEEILHEHAHGADGLDTHEADIEEEGNNKQSPTLH